MGLPEILIEFKTKAETAITRSENGIVAMILLDTTKTDTLSYTYSSSADSTVSTDWSELNQKYLRLAFKGSPKKVLVERIITSGSYTAALARLKNKNWNWLCIPGLESKDVKTISTWITDQRSAKKTFKAVLPNSDTNDEGIVNFTTSGIITDTAEYSTNEYCARIAGLLAGLPMTQSATYYVLDDIKSITESTTPDDDIEAGKFIIINDGEKFKVGRAVNSLHILSGDKTDEMKKIKIIEGMDLMRDDIRNSFAENYVGINNSYDNKMLFIAAVNQYFSTLVSQGVLDGEGDNAAEIDLDAQRDWLSQKYDVSEYTDDQIRKAKTGSYLFVKASVTFMDAIEDLQFSISME